MKYKYASDCHTHSDHSPDGEESITVMLDRAAALGLYAWTLTDHCEAQAWEKTYRELTAGAWSEMTRLTEKLQAQACPAQPRFYRGVELGQAHHDPAAAQELWQRDYDLVIGSIHNLRNKEDFYYMKYEPEKMADVNYLLREYWAEELEMIQLGLFDTLGHLTYPLRYMEGRAGLDVSLEPYREQIDEIFRQLIRKEKALEINTSGLRQELGRTMPDLPLLRRYRELGGKLVTIGSDAHCTADLAQGIDEGFAILREAGFTEFCVYEKHQPVLLPLE